MDINGTSGKHQKRQLMFTANLDHHRHRSVASTKILLVYISMHPYGSRILYWPGDEESTWNHVSQATTWSAIPALWVWSVIAVCLTDSWIFLWQTARIMFGVNNSSPGHRCHKVLQADFLSNKMTSYMEKCQMLIFPTKKNSMRCIQPMSIHMTTVYWSITMTKELVRNP